MIDDCVNDGEIYESCDLCRFQDNKCLVYDDLQTAGGLLIAKYDFSTFTDATRQFVTD